MATEIQKMLWREKQRKWVENNRDKYRAYQREYYNAHKKQFAEYARKYRTKTLLDKVLRELNDLRRHLRDFANGGDPTKDVIVFLDEREHFCRIDCENEIPFEITKCRECARKRLNAEVER